MRDYAQEIADFLFAGPRDGEAVRARFHAARQKWPLVSTEVFERGVDLACARWDAQTADAGRKILAVREGDLSVLTVVDWIDIWQRWAAEDDQ